MNSFFCNVLQKQSFTDVLENRCSQKFCKFHKKAPVLESLFNKVAGEVLRTCSFTEHIQWLLLWFLQQNNSIFSVITINLGYNQKLSWKYCNYYHRPYIKISISYQKYAYQIQKCCSLSHQSPNFLILSSIYFCIFSIFLRESGVSHSYTVSLIESLSKRDCPIYQEENLPLPQNYS